MKQLESIIQRLLQTRDQSQIFHWNTKSYSAHKALEKFYDDLLDLTDNLFEICKGKYPEVFSKKAKIPFSVISEPNVTAETMISFFSSFNQFLEGVCKECEASGDMDIQDIVLDMKNATNKLLYLLNLK